MAPGTRRLRCTVCGSWLTNSLPCEDPESCVWVRWGGDNIGDSEEPSGRLELSSSMTNDLLETGIHEAYVRQSL